MTFEFNEDDPLHIETLAIRTGQLPTEFGSHGEPIFSTSSFVLEYS